MDENKLKQKYLEMQTIQQQANQVREQLSQLQEQVDEIHLVASSLDELKDINKGDEILVPIVNGIFIKAQVLDTDHVKMNVGSGTVTDKTIDQAKTLLLSQAGEIEEIRDKLSGLFEELSKRALSIEKESQELIEEYKAELNV